MTMISILKHHLCTSHMFSYSNQMTIRNVGKSADHLKEHVREVYSSETSGQ